MTAMFNAIKWCLFKQNSQRLAVLAVIKLEERNKAAGKPLTLLAKKKSIIERVSVDCNSYNHKTFWPEYWLAFLMCSLPINDIVSSRKLGLVSLVPATKLDKDAKQVKYFSLKKCFSKLCVCLGSFNKES